MAITPPSPDDPFGALDRSGVRSRAVPLAVAAGVVLAIGAAIAALLVFTGTDPEVSAGAGSSPDPVPTPFVEATAEPLVSPVAAETPAPSAPPPQPPGALGNGGPLWEPANLETALAAMREQARGAGKLASLRVDTDYLVAEYMRDKERISVYANRDGRVEALNTRIGAPTDQGVPVGRIDPAVPDSLRRRIARRAGAPVGSVDYLVLSQFGERAQWIGFLDERTNYDAQLNPFFARVDGTGLRSNGPAAGG